MNTEDRNKSLCENSMKMMVNIIKLSSFSIAKMSFGSAGSSPAATKNLQVNGPLLPQSPGSRKSEKPKNSSKPVSFLMGQTGESESSYVVHGERSHIDGKASAYIRKVHQKNLSDLSESSNLPPYTLPPQPRAVM
ncbi:hypothetical protein Ddye_002445 [Dipteronia dyeriana]|uniref:Uncharacterized protein n=1 Tax=Dipteronia dyeriana TaxID=168575 RepID=A0AAD9XQB2_9ROSI|nr:hypothetical protein Ddye_002445 [Dipteronia dyeriana]